MRRTVLRSRSGPRSPTIALGDLIGRKRPAASTPRSIARSRRSSSSQRITRLPALDSMTPRARAGMPRPALSPFELDPAPWRIVDTSVDGPAGAIPVRVYMPPTPTDDWLVYFHGGGGVIGSIRDKDPVTRYLAAATRCTVASVDYRLGPEAKHPAAIDDAVAAWRGIAHARDPARGSRSAATASAATCARTSIAPPSASRISRC